MFHRHKGPVISTKCMTDVSYGEPGIRRTDVLRSCIKCRKPFVEELKNCWTLEEVKEADTYDYN